MSGRRGRFRRLVEFGRRQRHVDSHRVAAPSRHRRRTPDVVPTYPAKYVVASRADGIERTTRAGQGVCNPRASRKLLPKAKSASLGRPDQRVSLLRGRASDRRGKATSKVLVAVADSISKGGRPRTAYPSALAFGERQSRGEIEQSDRDRSRALTLRSRLRRGEG